LKDADSCFQVTYRLRAKDFAAARAVAHDICIEQTVEFPEDLIKDPFIRSEVFGRVEDLTEEAAETFMAVIRYDNRVAASELTQLLNVLFGNISIKQGIRVERLSLSPEVLSSFQGPGFGRDGLRALLRAEDRPLLGTALKPLGLPVVSLAGMAHEYALGGIDIIKDDHGLTDQPYCPFEERVEACSAAVARAGEQTGENPLYFANVTAPAHRVMERARFARDAGAGGLLVSAGLVGFDTMRLLADEFSLPILFHPALLGSYVTEPTQGISHFVLFGQMARLAGADASIFPSFGGRFSFSLQDCRGIVQGAGVDMGSIRPIFPVPAGGMTLENVPALLDFYGKNVIFLIGGNLHRHGDLTRTCRRFRDMVAGERASG